MKHKKAHHIVGIAAIAFLSAALVVSTVDRCHAEQGETHVLGEIGDITVSEGELIDFKLKAPEGFGPDVTWTVTGLPEEGLFYEVSAFPGAEGYGAKTSGGRGGKVVKVTNLNREGEGSFAAALALDEPRIIVFDVSGVIEGSLPAGEWVENKAARFYVANAPVTIAGQTAPGAGITLSGQLVLYNQDGGDATDNAIVRFLRTRSPYHRGNAGDNVLAGGNRVIFDHVSGAWGNDENFDLSNLSNATFQWSGVEEAAGYGGPWEVYTDKDADGMLDVWERKVRDYSEVDDVKDYIRDINPNEDLDNDGDSNLTEFQNGTNPLLPGAPVNPEWISNYDSDGDGLADWWEERAINKSKTDQLKSLADIRPQDDLDGDLSSNIEEHEAGTTPLAGPGHNYGMIMGYEGKNISLHHNFFAHHKIRTPISGVNILDHRNNVIYNCGVGIDWHPTTMNQQEPGTRFKTNIVGNYFKPGPNSPKTLDIPTYFDSFISGRQYSMIFADNNFFAMIDEPSGYLDIFDPNRRRGLFGGSLDQKADALYSIPKVQTFTAEKAYDLVMAHAGCLPRDTVTRRNVNEIMTGTGKWGKEVPEGGLMEGLTTENAATDTDNDGMPDEWETLIFELPGGATVNRGNVLDPTNVQDSNRIVNSGESALMYEGKAVPGTLDRYKGYTYIEYYTNELSDKMILEALEEAGYDETFLPGYGATPIPGFSWVPGFAQAGEYEINITASDGMQTLSESVRVSVDDTNRNPIIYASMYRQDGNTVSGHQMNSVEAGEHLSIEFYVQDIDGDDYSVSIDNKPDGAVAIDAGRTRNDLKGVGEYDVWVFDWTPAVEDVGWSDTITINIVDGFGGVYSKSFDLQVIEADNPLYTITALADPGGVIHPSGEVIMQEGDDRSFLISTEEGYAVSDIIIDGEPIGATGVESYIFTNVTENHSIEIVFDKDIEIIGGLIMKLDFDGNMKDSSGLENHGIAGSSSPMLAHDRFGNPDSAYSFDGIDNYIKVPDSLYFDSPQYTLTAWIYGKKDFYDKQYVVSKNSSGGTNAIGLYAVYNSIYSCGTGYPHTTAVLSDKENQWHHLSVVRKLSGVEFFFDGISQGTINTGYNVENDLDLIIGAKSSSSEPSEKFFNGLIDDVRLYNRPLSPSEVAVVAGKEGDWTPLKGDLNSDGKVDKADLDIVSAAYGTKPGNQNWNPIADLNINGVIDIADLVSVASNYGAERNR